jgi:uncharacterized protein (DUF1330 family)
MKSYLIVGIAVEDHERFRDYALKTTQLLKEAGIKVLVVDPKAAVLEGSWKPSIIVIQEYPDRAAVDAFMNSEAYLPLIKLRQEFSKANVIVVDEFSPPA